jgi:hypothetical protein
MLCSSYTSSGNTIVSLRRVIMKPNSNRSRDYDFHLWLSELFQTPKGEPGHKDLWKELKLSDGKELLKSSTRLFENPQILAKQYDPDSVEEGLRNLSLEINRWIWEKQIDWPIRQNCLLAMVKLFEELFERHGCGDACFMWWDHLRSFEDDPDPMVIETMLEVLAKILKLNDRDCQISALHGLGHLKHPNRQQVIESFLASHPELNEQSKRYAEAAIEGKIL